MKTHHDEVNQFDADKGENHASQSPDEQVPAQQSIGTERPEFDSLEGDWNERRNNQRVKNYSRQNGRGG